MGQEYFKDKYAVELIRDTFNKRPVTMLFQSYHKYEFKWASEGNLDFKVNASYGGDSDRIYRYYVSCNESIDINSLSQLKNHFNYIEIHNYTNELIYSWED